MFYKFDHKLCRLVLSTQFEAYYPTAITTRAPRVIEVELQEPVVLPDPPAPPPAPETVLEPVCIKVKEPVQVAKPQPPPPIPPPPPPPPPPTKVKYISNPRSGYSQMSQRIMELQDLFQRDAGVPIYLKKGRSDRILYYLTLVLCGLGTLYAFGSFYVMIYPPLPPCEEEPPPPPPEEPDVCAKPPEQVPCEKKEETAEAKT